MSKPRFLLGICFVLVAGSAAAFVWFTNQQPEGPDVVSQMFQSGNLSGALRRLSEQPQDERRLLVMQANVARQLGDQPGYFQSLEQLRNREDAADDVKRLETLVQIQYGQSNQDSAAQTRKLEVLEADPIDVRVTVALGLLAKQKLKTANRYVEEWKEEQPGLPHQNYIEAVGQNLAGNVDEAVEILAENIKAHPEHELSYMALAEIQSTRAKPQLRVSEAIYRLTLKQFPGNQLAVLKLAGVLRELGKSDEAMELLEKLPDEEEVLLELAEVFFDQGKYAESLETLEKTGIGKPDDFAKTIDNAFGMTISGRGNESQRLTRRVSWAASALALNKQLKSAQEVFDLSLDRVARLRRLIDLQVKQQLFPDVPAIGQQMDLLTAPASTAGVPTLKQLAREQQGVAPPAEEDLLYRQHCSSCHGEDGLGLGKSARHLFPAPRNFQAEPMRYVTGRTGLSTDEDLSRTIREGLHGVSMPGFPDLEDQEVASIVKTVRRLQRAGLEKRAEQVPEMNASEQEKWIANRLQDDETIAFPESLSNEATDADEKQESESGQEIFVRVGCQKCHQQDRIIYHDSLGRPLLSRNIAVDPIKGGDSAEQLYARILLGIPGTPHPSLELPEEQLVKLTRYVRSIVRSPRVFLGNAQRREELVELNVE